MEGQEYLVQDEGRLRISRVDSISPSHLAISHLPQVACAPGYPFEHRQQGSFLGVGSFSILVLLLFLVVCLGSRMTNR